MAGVIAGVVGGGIRAVPRWCARAVSRAARANTCCASRRATVRLTDRGAGYRATCAFGGMHLLSPLGRLMEWNRKAKRSPRSPAEARLSKAIDACVRESIFEREDARGIRKGNTGQGRGKHNRKHGGASSVALTRDRVCRERWGQST